MGKEKIIKILQILFVIMLIVVIFEYCVLIEKTNRKKSEGNILVRYSNGKTEKVEVSEEEIKQAFSDTVSFIYKYYSKANINQYNDIKFVYNKEDKKIERMYLNVNFDRYFIMTFPYGNSKIATISASLDRYKEYKDTFEGGASIQALYDVSNLPTNCGLASKEDNEILTKLLNDYNSRLSKKFYWQIETYRNY